MNCPKCSMNNAPDAMFCAGCGSPLNAATPVAPYQPEIPVVEPVVVPEAPANPYGAPAAPQYTAAPAPNYSASQQPQQYQTYQQPYASVPQYGASDGEASKDWAGITALITGIASFFCCVTGYAGIALSIAAIIFGAIGLKSQKKGMAIAGLILGVIAILFSVGMLILFASLGYSDITDFLYYYVY